MRINGLMIRLIISFLLNVDNRMRQTMMACLYSNGSFLAASEFR